MNPVVSTTPKAWPYAARTAPWARSLPVTVGIQHATALAWRGLVRIKHKPIELINLSVLPLMLLLLFTYVLGAAVAPSTHLRLQTVLPGALVLSAMLAAQGTGTGFHNDLRQGFIDRLRALPVARWAPLAGRVAADTVRQVCSMALLLAAGTLLGFRWQSGPPDVLAAFGLLLAFGFAMSWVAVLFATLVDDAQRVRRLCLAVIIPLTFTSGAFVPKSRTPGWLEPWVQVNPVTALVDAVRALLTGGGVAGPVSKTLLWAALLTAVFLPLALHALRRRA